MKAHLVWALALAVVGLLAWRDGANRQGGRYEAEIASLEARIAEGHRHRDVVHDTVRVKVREVRTLRDTLSITDTVMVRVFVERCTEALDACTRALAVDSSLIAGLTRRVDLGIAQRKQDQRKALVGKITWLGIGFVAGSLAR